MTEMHDKSPWEDIKGAKHNGLRGKSHQSLTDCIEFHNLMVFNVDAAERLNYYLMCSVNSLSAKSVLAGEKPIAMYSIST
jgi:hypothetical protein